MSSAIATFGHYCLNVEGRSTHAVLKLFSDFSISENEDIAKQKMTAFLTFIVSSYEKKITEKSFSQKFKHIVELVVRFVYSC